MRKLSISKLLPILLLALTAPTPALAFNKQMAELFLKGLTYGGKGGYSVPLITPAFCEAVVKTLAPEHALVEGLMAIEGLQKQQAERAYYSCLNEVRGAWEGEIAKLEKATEYFRAGAKDKLPAHLAREFRQSWQSILYAHQAFLRRGGKLSDGRKFCAEYQAQQKRDNTFVQNYAVFPSLYDTMPAAVILTKEHGLTAPEIRALLGYSDEDFEEVNPALRKPEVSEKIRNYAEVANSALGKMKQHEGMVVRYDCLPPSVAAEHAWGASVHYKAFTSTSSRQSFQMGLTCESESEQTYRKVFICTKGRGASIKMLSANPHEDEVLFPAGSNFQVVEKHPILGNPRGELHVMVALDEKGKPTTSAHLCAEQIKQSVASSNVSETGNLVELQALESTKKRHADRMVWLNKMIPLVDKKNVAEIEKEKGRLKAEVEKKKAALQAAIEAAQDKTDLSSAVKKAEAVGQELEAVEKPYQELESGDLALLKEARENLKVQQRENESAIRELRPLAEADKREFAARLKKFEAEKRAYLKSRKP